MRWKGLARLLQIQRLFSHPLDISFHRKTKGRDLNSKIADCRALGKYSIGFPVHLLEQKVQALANFATALEQAAKLSRVNLEARQLLLNVRLVGNERGLFEKAGFRQVNFFN